MRQLFIGSLLLLAMAIGFNACSGDSLENPFDDIEQEVADTGTGDASPFSITGLHRDVFLGRCAVPACHDGAFEPDFRSVQSSYSTLVYHPVTKNNEQLEFQFRVVPFDPDASVLIERLTNCCFVNQDDRMPQDNIGVPLPEEDVVAIRQWINDGAKDVFDKVPIFPNTRARVLFFVITNSSFDVFYSENRIGLFESVILPKAEEVNLVVSVSDDSTAVEDLVNNRVLFSTDSDDFSAATTLNSEFIFFEEFGDFWVTNFNTSQFPENTVIYFRVYSNDGEQETDTEFPEDDDLFVYKDFYSFIVQ